MCLPMTLASAPIVWNAAILWCLVLTVLGLDTYFVIDILCMSARCSHLSLALKLSATPMASELWQSPGPTLHPTLLI